MTEPLPDVVVATSRLRAAIEESAAALAGADLERLLATDAVLQKTLNDIHTTASLDAEQRARLRHEVEAAQSALRRCRRLGAALADVVRYSLAAQGRGIGYEPSRTAAASLNGRTFNGRA